jgi:hypothetical protein
MSFGGRMSFVKHFGFLAVLALGILSLHRTAAADAPRVGRNAAAKYFQANGGKTPDSNFDGYEGQPSRRNPSNIDSLSTDQRYLAIGVSDYTSSSAYNWGMSGKEEGIGKWGLDMTYRISEYNNLLDQAVRISYTEFQAVGKRASKMSFMYALTLPDAGSKFPLYFGFAAGPGIFFKQLEDESNLSLDYQLFLGLRLFNVFENTGFYVEAGLKNHLQLTSDGQVNGSYISTGAIFTF